jgi:hypothetical protein
LAYYRPEGIEAFTSPDNNGFDLMYTRGGRQFNRHVGLNDWVTHIEAGVILRPQVTRVAIYKWVENGRLVGNQADDGTLVIHVQHLLDFIARNPQYRVPGHDGS